MTVQPRSTVTAWSGVDPAATADAGARLEFIAEMFYRSAYYDSQLQHGPSRITGWLNGSGRPDWVTTTEATDKNFVSFGCDFLFLHFLHTQKGRSVQDIITKGAANLEATYTDACQRRRLT